MEVAVPKVPSSTNTAAECDPKPFKFSARIPYATEEEATIVQRALSVDPELRPEFVERKLTVDGNTLLLDFAALDARTLRAAVGTFCDLLKLATETLEAFPPLEKREDA